MINQDIYNEDCMVGMKRYPDKYFDLAIVDVQYGIGESNSNFDSRNRPIKQKSGNYLNAPNRNYERKEWDKEPPPMEYFYDLFKVSKNQIIWGANHFISRIPYDSSCWIVWDKINGDNDFADCELPWTSFDKTVRIFRYMWAGMFQGLSIEQGHIQQGNKSLNEHRIHPTQKPVKFYEWLLKNYAKQGDKILDTHGGSMSIAIACYNLNFDLTLFEIDKDYFEAGKKRLEEHKKQQRLFDVIN